VACSVNTVMNFRFQSAVQNFLGRRSTESFQQEIYFMEQVKMTSICALRELTSDIQWVQVPCSVSLA